MKHSKRKNLLKFLIEHDITRKELAEKLGVSYNQLCWIINGDRNVSLTLLVKFKRLYQIESFDKVLEIWNEEV